MGRYDNIETLSIPLGDNRLIEAPIDPFYSGQPRIQESNNLTTLDERIDRSYDISLYSGTQPDSGIVPLSPFPKRCQEAPPGPIGLTGQDEVFQSFLPKVMINKVVLEYDRQSPGLSRGELELYYNKNPHIDLSGFEANQLAAHPRPSQGARDTWDSPPGGADLARLITRRRNRPNNLTATVNFELRQPKSDFPFPLMENETFRDALEVKVYLVYNNINVYNELLKDGEMYKDEWKDFVVRKTLSWNQITSPEDIQDYNTLELRKFEKKQANGITITVYPFEHEFNLGPKQIDSLGIVVFTQFNIGTLNTDPLFFGNVVSDRHGAGIRENESPRNSLLILEQNKVSSTTGGFLLSSGAPWEGPVHQMENGRWMTGLKHSRETSRYLSRKTIQTAKVQDFRISNVIENIQMDFDITDNDLFPNLEKGLYLQDQRIDINKSKNYFSDLFGTRDEFDQCRFAFLMNWKSILIDNSLYGKLFKDRGNIDQLMNYAKITSMKISRIRIEGSSETGSPPRKRTAHDYELPTKPKLFDCNQAPELLWTTKDDGEIVETVNILNPQSDYQKEESNFKELTNQHWSTFIPIGSRFFTGVDGKIADKTDGYYQYKVELEILDASIEIIKNKYADLSNKMKILEEYYNVANLTSTPKHSPYLEKGEYGDRRRAAPFGNYNFQTKSFSQNFIEYWTNLFGALQEPINAFVDVLRFFSSNWNTDLEEEIKDSLLDYIYPEIATPQSINVVLETMQTVLSKIEDIIGVVDQQNPKRSFWFSTDYQKSKPSGNSKTFMIEKTFSYIFSTGTGQKIGADYIGTTVDSEKDSQEINGLKFISPTDLWKYFHEEKDSYWTGGNNLETPGRDPKAWENMQNFMDATLGSFCAPRTIRTGKYPNGIPSGETSAYTNPVLGGLTFTSRALANLSTGNNTSNNSSPYPKSKPGVPPLPDPWTRPPLSTYMSFNWSLEVQTPDNQNIDSDCKTSAPNLADLRDLPPLFQSSTQSKIIKTRSFNILFDLISATTSNPENKSEILPIQPNRMDMYSLSNPNSLIRQNLSKMSVEEKKQTLLEMPPQIKCLVYAGENSDKITPTMRTVQANLSLPENYCFFTYRTQMLNKLEVLMGFESDIEGEPILTKPIWEINKTPEKDAIISSNSNNLYFCRTIPYVNETLNIKRNKNFDLPTYDEYFITGDNT